ncbi:hypothetical protein BJX64DRAFT_287242 [Aspergillus heterothallicus]
MVNAAVATSHANLSLVIPPHALVVGIEPDVLFLLVQQQELAASLLNATFVMLKLPDGHDAFLLKFENLNHLTIERLKWLFPNVYAGCVEKATHITNNSITAGISVGEVD